MRAKKFEVSPRCPGSYSPVGEDGVCDTCGRTVRVLKDGLVGEHASQHRGRPYGRRHGHLIDNDRYPLDWARCGTASNARAHRRRGQDPCTPCLKAERLSKDRYR